MLWGVAQIEDFDDGVLYQLTLKKGEDEAVSALRTLASEDVTNIQHMAAYINHVIKNYPLAAPTAGGGVAGATPSLPSGACTQAARGCLLGAALRRGRSA